MSSPELFVSIDIETDGPAPGVNSMLALGAAMFRGEDGQQCGEWYAKLRPLVTASRNPETMEWWAHPDRAEAWEEVNKDQQPAMLAIPNFVAWLERWGKYKLIAVGWPIAFDFAFVNYYCWTYAERNPLGFAGLDIRSYINGILSQPSYYGLGEAELRKLAGDVDKTGLRPHVALDDAIEQGRLLMAVRKYVTSTHELDKHFND